MKTLFMGFALFVLCFGIACAGFRPTPTPIPITKPPVPAPIPLPRNEDIGKAIVARDEQGQVIVALVDPKGGEGLTIGTTYEIFGWTNKFSSVDILLEDWSQVGAGGPADWLIAENVPVVDNWFRHNWLVPSVIRGFPVSPKPGSHFVIFLREGLRGDYFSILPPQ